MAEVRCQGISTKQLLLPVLYLITAMLSFFNCIFNTKIIKGFEYISFFPIVFFFFGFILLLQVRKCSRSGLITVYIFITIQWMRLVLVPLIGGISGYFESYGLYVTESSAQIATFLMLYEAIITFIFCLFVFKYSGKRKLFKIEEVKLRGNKTIYLGFIVLALILFIATGAKQYQFFALNLSDERVSVALGNEGSVINSIVDFGLTFFVILILYYCCRQYSASSKKKYVYYALICAALRLCLISSEGRMSQIYLFGIFLMLLPQLFSEYRAKIIRYIVIVAVAVIGLMTIYKTFYAFLYDSYFEALKSSSFGLYDMVSQIDIYFYGIKTIARNINFCTQSDLSIFHCIFDLLRNTFGIHYLVKGTEYSTLEYYNLFIYSGRLSSGYLFSSLAYGYLYFGTIFAPICTCFNLIVSFWGEKIINRVRRIDVYYIVCMLFVRVSISMFSNFPQTWNMVSRTLFISVLVIGGSMIFNRKTNR